MNYMPSGTVSNTSCKDCVFAIYDNATQIGCEDDRIEKFKGDVIEAYDDTKEFFVINRICTLYRNNQWNNGEKNLEKAKRESELTFDLLIDCDKITQDMANYIKTLYLSESVSKKINIKIFSSYDASDETKKIVKDIFYNCPSIKISMCFDKCEHIYSVISKTQNLFHLIVDENNYENVIEFIESINSSINEHLHKAIIFRSGKKIAMSTIACRILCPNLYLNYENLYPELEKYIKENNLYIECENEKIKIKK